MSKPMSYDQIHTISFVKVVDDEGIIDAIGASNGILIIGENSKTGKAIGFYGNDLESADVFVGDGRQEVLSAFVESSAPRELEAIFGVGTGTAYFCEFIGGGIDGDVSDFEYENNLSALIGDEDNELDLAQLIDHVGISICSVEGVKVSIESASRSIRYNKQDVTDLGEWFNELQYDGAIRLILL